MSDYNRGEPLRIGNKSQLFVDDRIIEDRYHLRRVLRTPEKYIRNPVLLPEKPWEGGRAARPMVLYDEEREMFRMWYQASARSGLSIGQGAGSWICYAESDDGINWEKPLLDNCPVPGYPKTNIVYCGGYERGVQGPYVFRDETETDPDKRYKMITLEARPFDGGWLSGVNLAGSPDGLKWKLVGDGPLLDYHSDCFNHVVRDPDNRRWILYGRPMYALCASGIRNRVIVDGKLVVRHTRRKVFASVSDDLMKWSYPRIVMYPDEMDTSDYDACIVFPNESHFLMFYSAFDTEKDFSNEVRIAAGPDGFHWERFYTREPYISRGREGDWDAGQTMAGCPPVRLGDDLFIYYGGAGKPQSMTSTGGIGLAKTKVDRFVELRGENNPGYLLTREFILEGNRLKLNTTFISQNFREMYIKAEILKHPPACGHEGFNTVYEGFSLEECDPIQWTDRPDVTVTWKGNPDIGPLKGRPVYIRIIVQNMGLFSFRVVNE